MTGQGTNWVDEALREHEEHAATEHPATEQPATAARRRGRPVTQAEREQQVLDRIEAARRRRPRIREERITMSHGAGGKASRTLIEAMFLDAFRNPLLAPLEDAAELRINGSRLYLSAGFVLEEGFAVADLSRIVASMTAAAAVAGVQIVTGDTKVVERGKADGCYINTAGVGVIEHDLTLGVATAQPGDAVIVSGPVGDHGVTIMLARGELDIEADLSSDTAPLNGMIASLLAATSGVRAMRDATRGGVATILNEVATSAGVGVVVEEDQIPVRTVVRGAAELLGIDPMYVASEGRLVAIVDAAETGPALAALHAHPLGEQAAVIGHITGDQPGIVLLKTAFGGTRIVDLLVGDPLPRIC